MVTVFRDNVHRHPDKVIFHYEGESWTFRQLEDFSNQVANCFIEQGFKAGDEVALLLESRPEYVGLWLGLAKAGVIAALVNTNQRSQILVHSVTAIKCKALIFGPEFSEGESPACVLSLGARVEGKGRLASVRVCVSVVRLSQAVSLISTHD